MEAPDILQKPTPVITVRPSVSSDKNLEAAFPPSADADYNPCQNAKICSPFYLYNHDSPRPSADLKTPSKQSMHVSVRDLELGDLSPSVTQEKLSAQNQETGRFKLWCKQKRCLTKPKERQWLQKLPKRQRLLIKLSLALLIIGAMVGIAVGIAVVVHSGVNGSDKQMGQH